MRAKVRNVRLTIEYDGSKFHGWQTQKGHRTVQEELTEGILKATGERVSLIGASRTDAGVHALGQVANFRTSTRIPVDRLPHAINFYLPDDVSIRGARIVPDSFHSRFCAVRKTYRYALIASFTPRPLERRGAVLVRGLLNPAAMRAAANALEGRHDFRAFGSSGGRVKTTVRTVESIRIRWRGERVEIDVTGDGFLYNMVRCIAGTLLRAGQGRIDAAEVARILRQGDRKAAGPVAPAHALCLLKVVTRARPRPGA
ncbi:MAG TPA: tRNA pseudouridine(38-40) synthase TruA [Planctomycetota bacterium]|nr:tRNA pseudouridine(38-40) synthase TruA [Planctomycetota bacterium]